MNRLELVFQQKQDHMLNVFFTAGYPKQSSTVDVALALANNGVDMIEIGMPYSDPLADGTTIQHSSSIALTNGMNIDILLEQVKEIRKQSEIPIILMGYLNQLLKYGMEKFLESCHESGINGLIIPDLPMDIYESDYQPLFQEFNILISFLITPQTSDARIRLADKLSTGFIYVVADNSITGASTGSTSAGQLHYFKKIKGMKLASPTLIGFGITNHLQFETACKYANGAIIGSEFIRNIQQDDSQEKISGFITGIINN